MSLNRYSPHLIILTEDDANRQIVNGFLQDTRIMHRRVQAMPPAGGWLKVQDQFREDYKQAMYSLQHRHMLLVFDCDGDTSRIETLLQAVPNDLRERVFVLGTFRTPEALAGKMNMTREEIGGRLASECAEGKNEQWSNEHLRHNQAELERLNKKVVPFLITT